MIFSRIFLNPDSAPHSVPPSVASPRPPPDRALRSPPRQNRLTRATDSFLASAAAAPTARVRAPAVRAVTAAVASPRPPVAITPRRHLRAGETLPPRRLRAPVSSHRPSPSSATVRCTAVRRARRSAEAELGQRRVRGPCPALCVWAESDFGSVAPG
jgi:hypothetical protein